MGRESRGFSIRDTPLRVGYGPIRWERGGGQVFFLYVGDSHAWVLVDSLVDRLAGMRMGDKERRQGCDEGDVVP